MAAVTVTVSVLIPWSAGGNEYRRWNLDHVLAWWETHHPLWDVHVGSCTKQDGMWSKGLAVHRALQESTGQICVIADADVICPDIALSVDHVATRVVSWSVPHRYVHRLTEVATIGVLSSGKLPPPPWRPGVPSDVFERTYQGIPGGGMVIMSRDLLGAVPIDPRFRGWGQEDMSWGRALITLAGYPYRGTGPLFHLWHPPQPRSGTSREKQSGIGSAENHALWRRYQGAVTVPMMMDLVREARGALTVPGVVP